MEGIITPDIKEYGKSDRIGYALQKDQKRIEEKLGPKSLPEG